MRTIENERNRSKQKWPPEVFYKKRCSGKFHKIHKKRPVPDWTRTQNHLVRKRILNHLAKLAKWLSCVMNTYLYGTFDCMFLSSRCLIVKELLGWVVKELVGQGTPWLGVRLRTKWSWVQIQLQSLKVQISRLLRGRISLRISQL